MPLSTILQTDCLGQVFCVRKIDVSGVKQVKCLMPAPAWRECRVDRRVIIEVFAIIDGSYFDLMDGVIDFVDDMMDIGPLVWVMYLVHVGASQTQIRKNMQVRRMHCPRILLRICARNRNEEDGCQKS